MPESATAVLRATLGPAAWSVWAALQMDASDGAVVARREDLAGTSGLTLRSLDRALARLSSAGLISRGEQVRGGARWRVLGTVDHVPPEALAWSATTHRRCWGGRRDRTGRPAAGGSPLDSFANNQVANLE